MRGVERDVKTLGERRVKKDPNENMNKRCG